MKNNHDYLKNQLIAMAIAAGKTEEEAIESYNNIQVRVGPIFGVQWNEETQKYVEEDNVL